MTYLISKTYLKQQVKSPPGSRRAAGGFPGTLIIVRANKGTATPAGPLRS
jgi:hypothetical protein